MSSLVRTLVTLKLLALSWLLALWVVIVGVCLLSGCAAPSVTVEVKLPDTVSVSHHRSHR